jgi:ribose transport system ATP-binding protein
MGQQTILQIKDIKKSYFGVEVLHGINLDIKKGEILGLVGENGSGKSTLMNVLGGVTPKDSGEMILNGKPYLPVSPKIAQQEGIAFIHQELNLFSNLSVAENLFIDELPHNKFCAVNYKYMREKANEYIQKFEIQATPSVKVETLTMGVRQTVEIAKALVKNAQIIIFDEPTTSLSMREKDKLFKIINQLKNGNVTIIYISHILEDVFELCDRISVLRDGNIIGTEEKQNYDRPRIIQMMVGRELNQVYPTIQKQIGEVLFETQGVCQGNKVKNVSLKLRSGEIVGLFGLMGAGRTEFVRTLFGVEKMDSGEVTFNGQKLRRISPQDCIDEGMAFITEDRRQEGLIMPKTVKENLVLAKMDKMLKTLGMVDRKKEEEESDAAIAELNIKVYDKNVQQVKNLSGGNQQKVVIGKWIMRSPKLFILDEPTRGVDVGAKYEIYTIINNMAKNGSAILFVSSEMEELMGVCDRILIMSKGSISADIPKNQFSQETIIKYSL